MTTHPSTTTDRQIIRLGISTCPNDTFAFAALLERRVDWRGLEFQTELLDIQQLNDRLFTGDFDVAKTSFHAALLLAEQTVVLPSGSALGFGVGPLLLAARANTKPEDSSQVTLLPGQHTTAALLFHLFYRDTTRLEQVVFSDIMPRLQTRQADFGVCIHEGRFTWQDEGLSLVEDLGSRWEAATGAPLPLGGLLARRSLSDATIATVQAVVRESLETAIADPDSALPQMRKHAQEFDDRVLMQHVELYVNDWTVDLGGTGRQALAALSQQAKASGLIASDAPDLIVADAR
ncbi:1,4-dihydroxy-6-naphthoate synthase [Roseimaritima ulvae]|uniref:1,4-dihydroxy-6-naphtoate synthase n=1 Tax=Roseimaritima ulvae TaxID=980254 RepID=A0A5B9QSA1_9BACT|nr:1,4-dihydroxy-6-naphthoate synthase [Roseimaritima ulvae]QEG39916.1 1,4-dihydroxy-6-naphtoate synthase [Roseimaritima ulvae]